MKLNSKVLSTNGEPILVLHGLFGSSKNWISNGKELSKNYSVHLLDLRNHGDSPHSDSHEIIDLVEDLDEYLHDNSYTNVHLIGHSMGGLTVALFSLLNHEKVKSLTVVDIAPRTYPLRFKEQFSALEIDVSNMKSREDIDKKMAEILPDPFIRNFLQMNLEKLNQGYKWKLNVPILKKYRENLIFPETKNPFLGKTQFIMGELSDFFTKEDEMIIKNKFPNANLHIIPNANHYLHYTHSNHFLDLIYTFLDSN
jgi:esterase